MEKDADVRLLTAKFSPVGQRVQIALAAKGIAADVVFVDLSNKPQELLDANPVHKKVPVLIHNGKPVAESTIILEYLEDAFPRTLQLMPRGAHEKAKVRFWSEYVNRGFAAMGKSFGLAPGSPEKAAAAAANAQVFRTLNGAMLEYSADGPYFTGDKLGFLDAMLGSISLSLKHILNAQSDTIPARDQIPRFYGWAEAMKVHPAVSSNLPTEDEVAAFIAALTQKRLAAAAK